MQYALKLMKAGGMRVNNFEFNFKGFYFFIYSIFPQQNQKGASRPSAMYFDRTALMTNKCMHLVPPIHRCK